MSEPAVAVDSLRKTFGATVAVADLSFTIAPGEIYGLLGPNGAGKTTTLRILIGILVPTRGNVRVAGIDVVKDAATVRRRLGFLTNTTGLYPRLTGRELLRYFGRLHGLAPDAAAARIETLAGALQLGPFFDRRCEALSTGERQRLSIARAVLHDPAVLVLDEPTAALDPVAERQVVAGYEALMKGRTTILISHRFLLASRADRVVVLEGARIVEDGEPRELLRRGQRFARLFAELRPAQGGLA